MKIYLILRKNLKKYKVFAIIIKNKNELIYIKITNEIRNKYIVCSNIKKFC